MWRDGGREFVVGEKGKNPKKNLPKQRFIQDETHMKWPKRELETPAMGGEHLTACGTTPRRLASPGLPDIKMKFNITNHWFCSQGEENRFGLKVKLGDFYQYTVRIGRVGFFSDKCEMCRKVVGGNNYIFCHLQVKNDCNFIANFSDISTFLRNSKYSR